MTNSKKRIHQGKLLTIYKEAVPANDGIHVHEIIDHPGAVVLIAVDGNENILLVKQFREGIKQSLLELPAGTLELGEQPLKTAHRELREETGFDANEVSYIGNFYPVPGYCNENLFFYLAKGLFPSPLKGEDTDLIELIALPLDKLLKQIADNEIKDLKTSLGILFYKAFIHENSH